MMGAIPTAERLPDLVLLSFGVWLIVYKLDLRPYLPISMICTGFRHVKNSGLRIERSSYFVGVDIEESDIFFYNM